MDVKSLLASISRFKQVFRMNRYTTSYQKEAINLYKFNEHFKT